jgi:hypothetical protein
VPTEAVKLTAPPVVEKEKTSVSEVFSMTPELESVLPETLSESAAAMLFPWSSER